MKDTQEQWKCLGFPTKQTHIFPNIVNVEVFRGACPCNCSHCPVGSTPAENRTMRFGARAIDLGLFEKIAAETGCHDWASLRIHSVGEPVLWPGLPEALQIAHKNNARPWLFTCGVTNRRDYLDAICDYASIVEVSVNSIDSGNYLETKGIDAFELVCENIGYIHKRISKRGSNRLIVSRVQSQDPVLDEAFVSFWKSSGLVHDAFIRSYHTYNDCIPKLCNSGSGSLEHQPCLVHWARFNIGITGDAVVCFNELFKESLHPGVVMGDVKKHSISEIWHNEKYRALRKAELLNDYSGFAQAEALPCLNCSNRQPLNGQRQTSEHQLRQTTL
nr:radical SAM/SPASM domain-containing protein [Desulfatibacillum aliphaticivorans]